MKQVFLLLITIAWSLTGVFAARPNVVVIYTDDQALSQFGCYGGQDTPNIDRLAKNGLRLDRFYVSTAICAPSRYGLQTGRYASSAAATLMEYPAGGRVMVLQDLGDRHNRPTERWTLPYSLQQAGYTTGMVGKYHLGFTGERIKTVGPSGLNDPEKLAKLRHNFELAQQGCYDGGYDFAEGLWHDNPQPDNFYKDVQVHNQDWITWNALKFLDQAKESENPFLLVVNPTLVHWPPEEESLKTDRSITPIGRVDFPAVQPSRESVLERGAQAEVDGIGWFGEPHAAGVIWLDDAVGVLMDKLDAMGVADNTIVFVLSDHGRDAKWTCREGGIRSGGIVYWPGKIEPGRVSEDLVQQVDIAPTIAELAGAELIPTDGAIHGVSVADHLLAGDPSPRDFAFAEIGYQRAIVDRSGFKYLALRYPPEIEERVLAGEMHDLRGQPAKGQWARQDPIDALYHLPSELDASLPLAFAIKKSEHEMKNLVDDEAYGEDLRRLKGYLREISQQLPHAFGEFTETSVATAE
ncbi:MAG: sulfatase [Opitutales bacterium]